MSVVHAPEPEAAKLPCAIPWEIVKVKDAGEVQLGRQRAPKHATGDYIRPYLRVANVFEDRIDLSDVLEMNFTPKEFETFALHENDILLNEGQSKELVGRPALYRGQLPGVCFQNTLVRFRPGPRLDPKFALLVFRWYFHSGRFTAVARWTTNIAHLGASRFAEMDFPLPPLDEQKRIVATIEELFSELDAGIASLKTVRAQLKLYRQALLKHAFEGKLTEQWRADNADTLETADQLLARIVREREVHYQQQLKAWDEALKEWEAGGREGKKPSKPKKPAPLQRFTATEETPEPDVPKVWLALYFESLCCVLRNGISAKPEGDRGDKILRISAVRPLHVNLDDFRFLQNDDGCYDNYALKTGDLLFTRYNGTRKYVGVCGCFAGNERRLFPDKLIQARISLPSIRPEYVAYAMSCGFSRHVIERKIRTTAGQFGVSGADIKNTPVLICSPEEQEQIVRIVTGQIDAISQMAAEIDTQLQRAEALRQSVLKKAFSGQFVDPGRPALTIP